MMLKYIHNPIERALYTARVLGIHLNIDHESCGEIEIVRAMAGGDVIIHSSRADVVCFLSGLYHRVNRILSLLSSDAIDPQDRGCSLKSISETVAPKPNAEIYNKWIYGNKLLIMELNECHWNNT